MVRGISETERKIKILKKIALVFMVLLVVLSCMCIIDAVTSEKLTYTLPFVNYGGQFKYKSVTIFNTSISLYIAFYVVGFVAISVMSVFLHKVINVTVPQALLLAFLTALVGYIGAKIFYYVITPSAFSQKFTFSGLSFFGSVFGFPLFGLIGNLITRAGVRKTIDYGVLLGLTMLSIIRLACFTAGCCASEIIWVRQTTPLILPTQLFESILDLILLLVLLDFYQKELYQKSFYFLFLLGYGLIRIVCELMRDSQPVFLFLSVGSICSIASIIIGIFHLVYQKIKAKESMPDCEIK